jgi:hypothetical protein
VLAVSILPARDLQNGRLKHRAVADSLQEAGKDSISITRALAARRTLLQIVVS